MLQAFALMSLSVGAPPASVTLAAVRVAATVSFARTPFRDTSSAMSFPALSTALPIFFPQSS